MYTLSVQHWRIWHLKSDALATRSRLVAAEKGKGANLVADDQLLSNHTTNKKALCSGQNAATMKKL